MQSFSHICTTPEQEKKWQIHKLECLARHYEKLGNYQKKIEVLKRLSDARRSK